MNLRFFFISIFILTFSVVKSANSLPLDSVLQNVFEASKHYSKVVKSYESDAYMRTLVETKKKNFLYKYTNAIPNFVLHDLKNDEAIIETVSKIKFRAPNNYHQNVNYVTGTLTRKSDIALLPLKFISMDIYEESVPGETYYLPLREKSADYYDYEITSVDERWNKQIYKINYTPKYKNPQLLTGFFVVEEGSWRILDFNGKGDDLLFEHTFDVQMGRDSLTALLPVRIYIFLSYKYLGNHVLNKFYADLTYSDVQFYETVSDEKNYNLGAVYQVKLDSVPLNNDTVLWEKLRTFPLSGYETLIIEAHKLKQAEKEAKRNPADTLKARNKTLEFAKNMVMNTRYKHKSTTFNFSGLLNPALIGYSTWDGLTYKQSYRLNFDLDRQQSIRLNAFAGYIFKKKELSYQISGVWNYEPWKLGYLSLVVGKGNPTYSSRFLMGLQNDSVVKIDLKLARFRDYYYTIYNSIEITNGFQLGVGIDYHIREPIHPDFTIEFTGQSLKTQYHFVPRVRLTWTPEQYYVTDGIQKVNVRAGFPTFKIEYAQSLKDVLRGNSSFSRIEFDVNQEIRFDLMRKLSYHMGVGLFANQKDEYFNDFTYFAKSYFPETWGDGIGGGFSTLPSHIYNSAEKYAQGHFMYETPRFLLTRLPFLSNGVARERLYFSQLYLSTRQSFSEFGYGIGNRFINAAFFIALDGLKYHNIGGKAVFLL